MLCICVLIIAAAAVYMVEAYIHTYYAIEYMHGAPLFFVLLAKYAAPVLFLLLCGYFVFRYKEKRRESEKPALELLNMLAQLIIILLTNSTKSKNGTGKRQNEYEHSKNRNCIKRNAGPQWQHGLCL